MKSITVSDYDWEIHITTEVQCPYCGKYVKVEASDDDFLTETYSCDYCGKSFYVKTKFAEEIK